MSDNPFERYDLDPLEGPEGITARLRERLEDSDAAERVAIRAAWEELTLHPRRRFHAAIGAHPESRPAIGLPPAYRPPPATSVTIENLTADDLRLGRDLRGVLPPDTPDAAATPDVPFDKDRILHGRDVSG